ncbi:MAG: MCE family protein [Silvanigrellales bacterium]|nr:MCE family protein [Silvanigrellales bacterium]
MKQASRRTKAMVGGFVVVAFVVLMIVTLSMGNDLRFLQKKSAYVTTFANATGLNVGAPLKVGGVDIGVVEAVKIDVDGLDNPGSPPGETAQSTASAGPRVRADLIVYMPYDALLREGSRVSLETQGVLGDKFVALVPGPQGSALLAPGSLVASKEGNELANVVAQSGDIVDNVNDVTARVRTFAEGLPDPAVLGEISANIAVSSAQVARTLAELGTPGSAIGVVSNKESGRKIAAAIDDLAAASVSLKATAENLRQTSVLARSVVAKVDSGQGTLGALVNDPSLYDDVKTLLGRANRNRAVKFLIRRTLGSDEEEDVNDKIPK